MNDIIHLQGIGKVKAKLAKDFREGDIMKWNYGYNSKVLAIIKETKDFIVFAISGDIGKDDKSYTRRLKKNRLVAVGSTPKELFTKKEFVECMKNAKYDKDKDVFVMKREKE